MTDGGGRAGAADDYGRVSVLLHWTTAVLVLALLAFGELMEWTIDFDDQSLYASIKWFHIATGVVLAFVILPRIAWRLRSGWARPVPQHWLLQWAAASVPRLLLGAVLAQVVTGVLSRWTARAWPGYEAQSLPFLGLFEIPSPWGRHQPELNDWLEATHAWTAEVILILVAVHLLGAIKHWVLDRHAPRRMLGLCRDGGH